jgi:glycosyltransferase involved in cell wall biosynthesis
LDPNVVNNIPEYGILRNKIIRLYLYNINKILITLGTTTLKENILNSDYLIANSSQTKEELINFGIKKDEISVVNLGVDKRFLKPIPHNKKKNKFIIGYIGGLIYRKNLGFAIDAVRQIQDNNIIFEIYGTISKMP